MWTSPLNSGIVKLESLISSTPSPVFTNEFFFFFLRSFHSVVLFFALDYNKILLASTPQIWYLCESRALKSGGFLCSLAKTQAKPAANS